MVDVTMVDESVSYRPPRPTTHTGEQRSMTTTTEWSMGATTVNGDDYSVVDGSSEDR